MKKVLLILIPLLVLGGGGYWYFTKDKAPMKPKNIIERSKQKSDESYSGSLSDILSLGKSLKCTWSVEGEGMEAASWIKGEKVYTEVATPEGKMNTIFKDNCVWSWSDGANSGMKMCYEIDDEGMADETDAYADVLEKQEIVDSATGIDYKCKASVISDSKFNVPSKVNFMTWEDMMQGNLENLEENVQDMMPEDFDF